MTFSLVIYVAIIFEELLCCVYFNVFGWVFYPLLLCISSICIVELMYVLCALSVCYVYVFLHNIYKFSLYLTGSTILLRSVERSSVPYRKLKLAGSCTHIPNRRMWSFNRLLSIDTTWTAYKLEKLWLIYRQQCDLISLLWYLLEDSKAVAFPGNHLKSRDLIWFDWPIFFPSSFFPSYRFQVVSITLLSSTFSFFKQVELVTWNSVLTELNYFILLLINW
jgi:hypothetical protein